MESKKMTIDAFLTELASKRPVPGGGAASALMGAVGVALARMVADLTDGKEKYKAYQPEIEKILGQSKALLNRFLELMDEDAENFYPLSKAYALPARTEEERAYKEEELEDCSRIACRTPLECIETCSHALDLLYELLEKGTVLALSDVGCGAAAIHAALISAWLNIEVNIANYKHTPWAEMIVRQYQPLYQAALDEADLIVDATIMRFQD